MNLIKLSLLFSFVGIEALALFTPSIKAENFESLQPDKLGKYHINRQNYRRTHVIDDVEQSFDDIFNELTPTTEDANQWKNQYRELRGYTHGNNYEGYIYPDRAVMKESSLIRSFYKKALRSQYRDNSLFTADIASPFDF